MKKILLNLVVVAGVIVFVSSLVAGSESYSSKNQIPTPTAEPFDWSGLYGGLNVGAVFSQYDVNRDIPLSHPESTGVIGGGQLGLNFQWNHFVLGVEGDFQGASGEAIAQFDMRFNTPDPINSGSISTRREVSSNWFASARGRVGFAWNRLLFYATGGAAFTDLDVERRDVITDVFGITVFTGSQSKTKVGWTVGGGAEWAISHNLSAGIEYRHSDFGSDVIAFRSGFETSFTQVDFTADQVVAKINYRFWGFGQH